MAESSTGSPTSSNQVRAERSIEERLLQVAPLTWRIEGAAPSAQEEAECADLVNARGAMFLISRSHYIDVRNVCERKAQFLSQMAFLSESRAASTRVVVAERAGWHLAEYLMALARTEDEECFGILSFAPAILRDARLRQAFLAGFAASIGSRYDDEEERFDDERAASARQRRAACIVRLHEYLDRQLASCVTAAEITAVREQVTKQWAEAWFAGVAYCPRCKSDDGLAIVSSRREYHASIVETWTCGCGHSWKVEFQEAAVAANANPEPAEWIERHGVRARGHPDLLGSLAHETLRTIPTFVARFCSRAARRLAIRKKR